MWDGIYLSSKGWWELEENLTNKTTILKIGREQTDININLEATWVKETESCSYLGSNLLLQKMEKFKPK